MESTQPQRVEGTRGPPSRVAWSTAVVAVVVCAVLFVAFMDEMVRAPAPLQVDPAPAVVPAMTQHVLLLIPDGLRYEHATDSDWAPNFSRHMRTDTHGVLWAGRITMTSAAVHAIATGRRSDFAQLITNLNVRRAGHNDVVTNLRNAGHRVALAGDMTWAAALGEFDDQVTDESHIAIHVDNSPEILAAVERMVSSSSAASLVIGHVIATDHQAHAYQANTPRYQQFLRAFDDRLEQLLQRIPPAWTVMVFSDHSMTDTGAHGTDTEAMRKSPFFAFGRGIRPGVSLPDMDQVDIGNTVATLLGVPSPAHGVGTAVTEMLVLDDVDAARVACEDAARVERLAKLGGHDGLAAMLRTDARLCGMPNASAREVLVAARSTVRSYDKFLQMSEHGARTSSRIIAMAANALVVLAACLAGLFTIGVSRWRRLVPALACGAALVVTSVVLTYGVERLPPPFHNIVRGVLFVAVNAAMVWGTVLPRAGVTLFRRWPIVGLTLLPGALAVSYPANTQPEAWVVLLLAGVLWLFAPHADLQSPRSIFRAKPIRSWGAVAAFAAALVGLAPFGFFDENPLPTALARSPALALATGLGCVAAWLCIGARARDAHPRAVDLAVAVACAVASVLLRRVVNAPVGLAAMVGFPLLAVAAAMRGRHTLAAGFAFCAYAWVSRDMELVAVGCGALAVETIGQAASGSSELAHVRDRAWAVATLASVAMAAAFLVRVGLQGGLDLSNVDYGAGVFGDPDVSELRVFSSTVWKYATGAMLLFGLLLRPLAPGLRSSVALVLVLGFALRTSALAWILFECRSSYWTAFRTVSDLPTAAVLTVSATILLLATVWADRRAEANCRSAAVPAPARASA